VTKTLTVDTAALRDEARWDGVFDRVKIIARLRVVERGERTAFERLLQTDLDVAADEIDRLREGVERLRARAEREPLDVDVSDYGDEWCLGFLAGQCNALDVVLAAQVPPEEQP
jgi:hypothetical protein